MEEINLKEFFEYVKKYIILIACVVAVFVIGVCVYNTGIKVPLYTTYTTIVLTKSNEAQNTNTTITQNDILLNQKLVSTYSKIIKSKLVLEQVISEVGLTYDVSELEKNVGVEALEDTEILKISVQDSNPELASKIANSVAEVFSKEVSKIYQISNISVIDVAQVPEEISNNTLIRDLVIALFVSLFGSLAVIFVIYYFDDTIKLSDNLEEEINMPVIAKVFKSDLKSQNKNMKMELICSKYPKSVVSESIKTLRTNLQFSSVDTDLETILITSSIPGEGKSFISANLAISFTQTGKKVLLVDCDMRKGRQHRIFKISNSKGLSNLLIDDISNYSDYISKTSVDGLYLITRGTCPPNPSELLNSKKNKDLIKLLKTKFDIVIFDGVPCNGLPDSIIMSTLVDKVLIVSSDSVTPKALIGNTKKSLEKVGAPIAGTILNNVSKKSGTYGKYYGYYGDNDK
ncbi:MAG: polysaccharide biosynthesis tyrosine autokinase [Bacilli bacterium]|nr:polysaccharide biosynthesis tyrosine autokinase [Bacilli bacterium]